MLERGDARLAEVDVLDLAGEVIGPEVHHPDVVEALVDGVPALPVGLTMELGRRLTEDLLEGACERLVALVAARERDLDEPGTLLPERKLVRAAPETEEFHVLMNADLEERSELANEVELRESCDRRQPID
jgi:hypothetical protein